MAHADDQAAAPQAAAAGDRADTAAGDPPGTTAAGAGRRRRSRDRARTEADLLKATFELLQRDGVFAGLNLQEVAERAGVNRGQIYQYFGDRQSLLRSAVAHHAREWAARAKGHWQMPFAKRRRAMLHSALENPEITQVEALLAIDGDTGYHALPEIERTRSALERDLESGDLPADSDAVALHVLMVAAYKGYVVFRESFARDLGVPVERLDARVAAAQDQVLEALARAAGKLPARVFGRDHLEGQAGVELAQLLGRVRAIEAVPADEVDTEGEHRARQAVHVAGREGALGDSAPDGVAEHRVGLVADLDDLLVVPGGKPGELVLTDPRGDMVAGVPGRVPGDHRGETVRRVPGRVDRRVPDEVEGALVAGPDDLEEHEFLGREVHVERRRAQAHSGRDVPGGRRVVTVRGEAADRPGQQPPLDIAKLGPPQIGGKVL